MTTMKKLASLILAILMLGMVTLASATDLGNSFTITGPDNSGHTYQVYQIFTGSLSEKDNILVLSDVKWGENGTGTKDQPVTEDVLTALKNASSLATDAAKLEVITQYVDLTKTPFGTVASGATLTGVPAGYYLIKDTDNSLTGEYESYTTYIVEIVDDITINPKSKLPEMFKKLKDINDSESGAALTGWQDTADWDIGDQVPFLLQGTVAENIDEYPVYKYTFHDKMCDGLDYVENSAVFSIVNGDSTYKIESGISVVEPGADGCSVEFVIDDLLQYVDDEGNPIVNKNSKITVEYKATLNENAEIGAAGNPNEARLEFSNNPNQDDGSETGKTPWDQVIVYTFAVEVEKVDQDNKPLDGAGFTLYKKDENGTYNKIGDEVMVAADEDRFIATWKGLDDGDYRLEETTTPLGYNTVAPIDFTVAAEHGVQENELKLISLTGDELTGTVETGVLSIAIQNKTGTELPTTGGIGTTIFYVAGGVLVLLAVVLLVTKRRVGEN